MFDFGSLSSGLQTLIWLFVAWGILLALSFRLNSWFLRLIVSIAFAILSFVHIFTGLEWGPYFAQDVIDFNARGHHTNPGPWSRIIFEIGWPVVAGCCVILGILMAIGAWRDHKSSGGRH